MTGSPRHEQEDDVLDSGRVVRSPGGQGMIGGRGRRRCIPGLPHEPAQSHGSQSNSALLQKPAPADRPRVQFAPQMILAAHFVFLICNSSLTVLLPKPSPAFSAAPFGCCLQAAERPRENSRGRQPTASISANSKALEGRQIFGQHALTIRNSSFLGDGLVQIQQDTGNRRPCRQLDRSGSCREFRSSLPANPGNPPGTDPTFRQTNGLSVQQRQ